MNHLMSNPRLLTAWCWREQGFPAFSPSTALPGGAKGLHEELLLGFDVGQDCAHSVLSMAIERKPAEDEVASVWSVVLQARLHKSSLHAAVCCHGLSKMHVRTACSWGLICFMGYYNDMCNFLQLYVKMCHGPLKFACADCSLPCRTVPLYGQLHDTYC